jgi:HAD superfamily hydrolase (TIGR01549 family)
MIKAVIFDFDGVIVESMDVKTAAFATLFKAYPHHVAEIIKFHQENGGMNRFRKFEIIYEKILRKPLQSDEMEELGRRFSSLVIDDVVNAPLVAGAHEFLEAHKDDYALCIVSATPEDELREIVKRRSLTPYFRSILGAPSDKAGNLRKILKEYRLSPEEAVFVGDALADFEGARKTAIPFVARVATEENNPFAGIHIKPVIRDLTALRAVICNFFDTGMQ